MVQRNLVVQAEVPYRERAVRGERRHMPLTLSALLHSLLVAYAPYLERPPPLSFGGICPLP